MISIDRLCFFCLFQRHSNDLDNFCCLLQLFPLRLSYRSTRPFWLRRRPRRSFISACSKNFIYQFKAWDRILNIKIKYNIKSFFELKKKPKCGWWTRFENVKQQILLLQKRNSNFDTLVHGCPQTFFSWRAKFSGVRGLARASLAPPPQDIHTLGSFYNLKLILTLLSKPIKNDRKFCIFSA